jgi:hypothetical protein
MKRILLAIEIAAPFVAICFLFVVFLGGDRAPQKEVKEKLLPAHHPADSSSTTVVGWISSIYFLNIKK